MSAWGGNKKVCILFPEMPAIRILAIEDDPIHADGEVVWPPSGSWAFTG